MPAQVLQNKAQALSFVEQNGECVLFPLKGYLDLFSQITGSTIEDRRKKAWSWSDDLHLKKKLFSSLAIRGRVTLTSWHRFNDVHTARAFAPVTSEEEVLMSLVCELGPIATPDLYRASGMLKPVYIKALKRLRQKMRLAVVEIERETATKHIYKYDLTERWVPEHYMRGSPD